MYIIKLSRCPVCDSSEISTFFTTKKKVETFRDQHVFYKMGLDFTPAIYDFCHQCGLLFLNPRWNNEALDRLYGKEDIFRKSAAELYMSREKHKKKIWSLKKREISREDYYFSAGKRLFLDKEVIIPRHFLNGKWIKSKIPSIQNLELVDIGAGFGIAQKALEEVGFTYEGYESSEICVEYAKKWRRNVHLTSFQDIPKMLSNNAGLIYTNHFLEHVDKPLECLQILYDCLKTGGYLFISVPTSNYLNTNIFYALKNPNFVRLMMSWRHMNHFDDISLRNLLKLSGFEPISWKYRKESILILSKKHNVSSVSFLKPNKIRTMINIDIVPMIAHPLSKYGYKHIQKVTSLGKISARFVLSRLGMLKFARELLR